MNSRLLQRWSLLLCVAACLTITQSTVFAQDSNPEEQAEAFYQQAIQQLGSGRYREALASFDEAIKLVPNPIFYCNRSSVLLKLKEGREALASMEICLERLEIEDPQERATLDSEVKALRLAIEGLEPNSQRIARQIATRLVIPKQGPPEEVDAASGMEIAAWTTGAIGGVSLAGALVLELLTQPLVEEYKEVARDGEDQTRFNNLKLVLEQRKLLIGALVLTGAATAITSGVLFLLDEDEEPPQTTRLGLDWTQGGAVLHLQGAF